MSVDLERRPKYIKAWRKNHSHKIDHHMNSPNCISETHFSPLLSHPAKFRPENNKEKVQRKDP
jgi:hypothetical protein